MRRLSEKILTVFLAVLLMLIPLHGAVAGFVNSSIQKHGVHQVTGTHSDMVMLTADHSAHACEKCSNSNACVGHTCSTNLCAYCLHALLPVFSFSINRIATFVFFPSDNDLVNRHSPSPFRPPRAWSPHNRSPVLLRSFDDDLFSVTWQAMSVCCYAEHSVLDTTIRKIK